MGRNGVFVLGKYWSASQRAVRSRPSPHDIDRSGTGLGKGGFGFILACTHFGVGGWVGTMNFYMTDLVLAGSGK